VSGKVVLREKKGLPGPQHRLLYPEPEPELEPLATQIPEAPTPDVPVWNIEAFTLLDGKLVLLGNEDEVRGATQARKGEERKGARRAVREHEGYNRKVFASPSVCLSPLSDHPLLLGDRVLASPGWGALALRAASTWPQGISRIQVSLRDRESWGIWEPVKVGQNPR